MEFYRQFISDLADELYAACHSQLVCNLVRVLDSVAPTSIGQIRILATELNATLTKSYKQMSEPTNAARAQWAALTLEHFARLTNEGEEDQEGVLTDLLADLMHLADLGDGLTLSFERALSRARQHYAEERDREPASK